METTKLGLKIVKSFNGLIDVININDNASWTKSVRDPREDCKHVDGLKEDCESSVILYSSTEAGEFYTIASYIAGRNDILSAWIFCPNNIDIKGSELASVIDTTRREILASEINEEKLAALFSKEYPTASIGKSCSETKGASYAVRYYGDGLYSSLAELLNYNLAQPENINYKGIFLIDRKTSLRANECTDLSKSILKDSFIVNPPESYDGFVPCLKDKKFTNPIRVVEGEMLEVEWRKEGYKTVKTVTKIAGRDTVVKSITDADEYKYVKFSDFRFYSSDGEVDLDSLRLEVQGKNLDSEHQLAVHISSLNSASVRVACKGHKIFKGTRDLTSLPCKITLEPDFNVYNCTISAAAEDGARIECTAKIQSNVPLRACPIPGYETQDPSGLYQNRNNRLVYKKPISKPFVATITLIALLLGLAIGAVTAGYIVYNYAKTDKGGNNMVQHDNPPKGEEDQYKGIGNAVKYLNEKSEWDKIEMEKYEKLKGLWDAMNTYDFDKILKYGALRQSQKFGELCNQINQLLTNTNETGRSKLQQFNKDPHDPIITYDNYLKKIQNSIPHNEKPQPQQPQTVGQSAVNNNNQTQSSNSNNDVRDF